MELQEFYDRYKEWSHSTFGIDIPLHGLIKLEEEVREAKEQPDDIIEYADCLMCLLFAFSCQWPEKPISELLNVANDKLNININSEWIKQPNGTFKRKK